MKSLYQALFIAALAAALSPLSGLGAPDEIAASPKARQLLSRSGATARIAPVTVVATPAKPITWEYGFVASPKARQLLTENRTVVSAPVGEAAVAGYRPTGPDGVTASPRLRQQLDERGGELMVAPLK